MTTEHLDDPHFTGDRYVGVERRRPSRRRMLGLVDYRSLVALTVLAVTLLTGYIIIGAQQGRNRAIDAAIAVSRGQTDERRVASEERAQLLAELRKVREKQTETVSTLITMAGDITVLRRQLQEAGIAPAVPDRSARPHPTPQPSPNSSPKPKPSATPHPSPSPSPTCTPLPIIGCRG